ncbi:hypothetical protein GO755_30390 [Spirosoma sp. HMF4905]|uniref:Lipoprotein n=1 Tax=Spirosoma arboris TaxID=2682092 RepID=A0A7K1SKQ5_9BACT|nr:hypothetical protein [Spirosoma arboris]MVM34380.1 hypothetical protein [Spirosoma arboris]
MKEVIKIVAISTSTLILFSCSSPLDKRYNSETMWADVREGSTKATDSLNHELCGQAVADNAIHGVKNEDFTYRELIDKGYKLLGKAHSEAYIDSLRKANNL